MKRHKPLVRETTNEKLAALPFCTGTLCPNSVDYDKSNDSLGILFLFLYPYFLLDFLSRFIGVYIENLGTEIDAVS